jgi:hypothetical protein
MADAALKTIAVSLVDEINLTHDAGAYLATMILCGSVLEVMLLDIAEQIPGKLQFASSSKNWADRTALAQVISEFHGLGLFTSPAKALSVAITDHRDLVHPNRRRKTNVRIDEKTAQATMKLVEIVAHDLYDAAVRGDIANLK